MSTLPDGSPTGPVDVVRRYLTAYAAADAEGVAPLLRDDVAWVIHGHLSLTGKAAFLAEMARPGQTGLQISAERVLTVSESSAEVPGERLVLALGHVRVPLPDGADFTAAFADVFTVDAGRIARLESYVVPLTGMPGGTG